MIASLRGKKVLVTRESSQAKKFSNLIQNNDGIPIEVPLLAIRCQEERKTINPSKFDWIFFTSAHGVNCFFSEHKDKKKLKHCLFATVGHKTENALKNYGYEAAFIPTTYHAEAMAEEFFHCYPKANNVLLVRGNLSRRLLVDELTERKLQFDTVVVCETTYFLEMKETLLAVLKKEKIDFLTFTSPSTIKAFIEMIGTESIMEKVLQIPCVCIGTTTEKTAKQYHFATTIVPDTFTIEHMVESMIDFIQMEGSS